MQSFKHIFLAASITSFTFSVQAHEITITSGGLSSTLNSEQNYVAFASESPDLGIHSADTQTVIGGEFALGYIWNVNKGFDLGFEVYYDWVNSLQVQGASNLLNIVNLMYGVRVLPGFKITNNTKIYLDLGYNLMDQTLDISNTTQPGFSSDTKDFTNEGAFQYGVGVETLIYKNIGVRLAYTVQQNNEVKFENEANTQYFTAIPTVYNFFFGLSYHFQF